MSRSDPTLRKSTIILCIAIVGFLKPPAVTAYPSLNLLFDIMRIVSSVVVFSYVLFKRIKPSPTTKSIILYQLFFLIVTGIRKGNIVQAAIIAVTISGEICLFELGIKWKIRTLFRIISHILVIYVIVNFIFMILMPSGFTQSEMGTPMYFLGIHNRFVFWMLPLFCYLCINNYISVGKLTIQSYVIIGISLLSLLQKNAAGGFIGLALAVGLTLLFQDRKYRFKDYRLYLLVYFAFWLGLTLFDTMGNWEWLTTGILHKVESLLARLSLWSRGKAYIASDLSHALFGYGLEADSVIKEKFWYSHLHNNLLNVIYQTGIIGGILYNVPFILIAKNLVRFKNDKVSNVVSVTLFAFLIILLMDTYDLYGHFYTLLVIAANIKGILKVEKRRSQLPILYNGSMKTMPEVIRHEG